MRPFVKVVLLGLSCAVCCMAILIVSALGYAYVRRSKPVLYQTQAVNIAPLVLIQNPFRDKSRELAAQTFLSSMRGKTVTQSLEDIKGVRFNNPSGYVEKGELLSWELSNRRDEADASTFYYFVYRGNPEKPILSFATVTVRNEGSSWVVSDYKGLGTSNNS